MTTSPESLSSTDEASSISSFPFSLWKIIALATLIFFGFSSLRHFLFQSTAYDLGIYDQIVYLISQGQSPISSFLGFHFLGDHGALAIYPLALLYKIYPSVYWLFLIQGFCLAVGAGFIWQLAQLGGLNQRVSLTLGGVYLLYPEIFNINLFDFHPDVLALPAFFGVVVAAKQRQIAGFCLGILWILSCKAVFALTVIALGIWLLFFEKRQVYGAIAISLGVAWFLIVTQLIIPFYSGNEAAGVSRYSYLGDSVLGIIANTIFKPHLILGRLISFETFFYLLQVCLALIWWLSPVHLTALIPAIPTLLLNILSVDPMQRSLIYQYSLPVLPFLFLAVIRSLANPEPTIGDWIRVFWQRIKTGKIKTEANHRVSITEVKLTKKMIVWSLLIFILWGDWNQVIGYFTRLDTWQASQQAFTQIRLQNAVLTDNRLAPHATHRPAIKLLNQVSLDADLVDFNTVILNLRHPWPDTQEIGETLNRQLSQNPQFKLTYQQNDVVIFQRNS